MTTCRAPLVLRDHVLAALADEPARSAEHSLPQIEQLVNGKLVGETASPSTLRGVLEHLVGTGVLACDKHRRPYRFSLMTEERQQHAAALSALEACTNEMLNALQQLDVPAARTGSRASSNGHPLAVVELVLSAPQAAALAGKLG